MDGINGLSRSDPSGTEIPPARPPRTANVNPFLSNEWNFFPPPPQIRPAPTPVPAAAHSGPGTEGFQNPYQMPPMLKPKKTHASPPCVKCGCPAQTTTKWRMHGILGCKLTNHLLGCRCRCHHNPPKGSDCPGGPDTSNGGGGRRQMV